MAFRTRVRVTVGGNFCPQAHCFIVPFTAHCCSAHCRTSLPAQTPTLESRRRWHHQTPVAREVIEEDVRVVSFSNGAKWLFWLESTLVYWPSWKVLGQLMDEHRPAAAKSFFEAILWTGELLQLDVPATFR
eukprot:2029786-Amphidinium_carterae.2